MKKFKNYTPTELLKLTDDVVKKHINIKEEIVSLTKEIDSIEATIKEKLKELEALEGLYLDITKDLYEEDKVK